MTRPVHPDLRRGSLILLLIAIMAGMAMAARVAASRQQELRVLICARNMAQGGDLLVPEFQEQTRLRKPPLAYWMAALPMRLAGVTDSPAVARAPFVFASCSLLALLGLWGRSLAGGWGGALAMSLPFASVGWWRHMSLAETDLPLLAFSSLAAWSLWRIAAGEDSARRWFVAAAATGLAFLAKGPAAFLPWVAFGVFRLSGPVAERPRVRRGRLAAALLLSVLLAFSWHLALWAFRGLSPFSAGQVAADLPATFTDQTAHHGPWFYYFYTLPKLLLPLGLALPWILWRSLRVARADAGVRFLLIWLGVVFLLMSLIPSKQEHYALQMLPACVLLTARELARSRPGLSPRLVFPIMVVAAALSLAVLAGLPVGRHPALPGFFRSCRPTTDPAPLVHVCGINSAVFDFYLGRHVHNVDQPMQAWRRSRRGEAVVVAARESDFAAWQTIPAQPLKVHRTGGMQGALYVKPGASFTSNFSSWVRWPSRAGS